MKHHTATLFETEYDPHCHFGIISVPLAAAIAGGLSDIGIGAGVAGIEGGAAGLLSSGLAGGLVGAGGGALLGEITGGNPLTGALTGGLTGGAIGGVAPEVASATGLSPTVAAGLTGGAAGLIGAEVTGGSPLTGILTGGGAGLLSGAFGSGGSGGGSSASVTGGAASSGAGSAASIAPSSITPPAATGAGLPQDLSAAIGNPVAPAAAATGSAVNPIPTGGGSAVSDGGGSYGGGPAGAPSSGNWLTNLFGGNSAAGTITATDAFGNPVSPTSPAATDFGGGGGAGGAGGAGGGLSGILSNPGVLLGGGALGIAALMGNQPLPAQTQLTQQAGELASESRALSSYIFSGTLPPGAQQAVDSATNAAIAKVKSSYAQLGMAGSTSEAEAVTQIRQSAAAQTYQMADQLLAQGASYAQLSDALYQTLLQTQQQQETALTNAIGTFAAGLAGASMRPAATGV